MARVMAVKSRQHLEDAALGASGLVDRHFILALYDEGQRGCTASSTSAHFRQTERALGSFFKQKRCRYERTRRPSPAAYALPLFCRCEDFLTDSTVFPFPFADKLDEHGIWWEDVLQTAKARLSQSDGTPSRLARRFGEHTHTPPRRVFRHSLKSATSRFESF